MCIKLKLYGSAALISDTNITALGIVMTGFSSNDLSSLIFMTTTSIGSLGSLNGWSTTQVIKIINLFIIFI